MTDDLWMTKASQEPLKLTQPSTATNSHQLSAVTSKLVMSSSKAIVLVDPITEWREVLKAALDLKYCVISIQDASTAPRLAQFSPSMSILKEAGVSYTLTIERRDVFDSIRQLQILMNRRNLDVVAVIPLSEVAVEASDMIAAALSLPHNPLKLLTARRDKGLMKEAVRSKGLAVARYARVKTLIDHGHRGNAALVSCCRQDPCWDVYQ